MSERAFREAIERLAPEYGLAFDEETTARFERHYALLVMWNRKVNLTRITEPEEAARRHVLESAFLTTLVDVPARLVDVGSGAGFPGIPIASIWSSTPTLLVEPLAKRAVFLKEVIAAVGLIHVRVRNAPFGPDDADDSSMLVARALDRFDTLLPSLLGSAAATVALFSEPDLLERAGTLSSDRSATMTALPAADRRCVGIYRR